MTCDIEPKADCMTNDTKHQVLYALYSEYQKDVPDMRLVDWHSVDISELAFNAALLKLQNEGYIQGLITNPPNEMNARKLYAVKRDHVFLTGKGVEYVEWLAGIEASETASAKIKRLAKQAGIFGMEILKDFILSQI